MSSATEHRVRIDEEFRSLVPPLSEEERRTLEENLVRDGCLDPLVVWAEEGILLDGHHRKGICDCYGIGYGICWISFPHRETAADWIDAHQLGRRNLWREQMSLLRGRRYNRLKKAAYRPKKLRQADGVFPGETAQQLAEERVCHR